MAAGGAELLRGEQALQLGLVEVVSAQVGELVTEHSVEADLPRDEYEYRLDFDDRGRVSGARSWRYNQESDERTFTRFDAEGNQLSRFVKCESLGTTRLYDANDQLESTSHVESDGKIVTNMHYEKGKPVSSSVIDRVANTHTMTLFQSDGTQYVRVTQWEGPNGWTSTAYPGPASARSHEK